MILAFVYLILVIGHQLAYARADLPAEKGPSFLTYGPTKTPAQSNLTTASKTPSTAKVEVTSEMSVSPRIDRIVLKENNNYNMFPNTRPTHLQAQVPTYPGQVPTYQSQVPTYQSQVPAYTNWSTQNGTQSTAYSSGLRPIGLAGPEPCYIYRSLNVWRDDQRRRINSIFNMHRKNGSYIVDFRIQKPNGFLAQSLWSFLPDGAQLYLLRQKELKAYNLLMDVQKRPCCYNNVIYDCVHPASNGTATNY